MYLELLEKNIFKKENVLNISRPGKYLQLFLTLKKAVHVSEFKHITLFFTHRESFCVNLVLKVQFTKCHDI